MMTITEMGDAGKGLALIANLADVDHDGDTYEPGAFNWKEQWCPLLSAHDRSRMQFGKARVFEEGDKAYAELHLNLGTQAGREWHEALKFDLATGNPVQEWSYGYDVLDADYQIRGQSGRVRRLKRLDVHEVSTVVRGAGRGTGTLSMKALKDAAFAPLIGGLGELADALKGDPQSLTATGRKQLEQIHAELGKALTPADPDAEAKAIAAIDNELAVHLTRKERLKFGRA
jgi:hypothetical protein